MKAFEVTIDWLSTLNPGMSDYPDNHRSLDFEGNILAYANVLGRIFPNPIYETHGQDCTHILDFLIPPEGVIDPRSGQPMAILSKFNKLHTVWCDWNVRRELLDRLVGEAQFEGFVYVPFSLFACERDCPSGEIYPTWRAHLDGKPVIRKIAGKSPYAKFKTINHHSIFNSLFNYL